ncbi:MAG TPA: BON domain-containing protein [Rhodanobacteraceae bacterium]
MRKTIITTTALLLCVTLAACSLVTPRRGFNRMFNDRNVQITAQHALDNDPDLNGQVHIGTSVYNGVLLLIGEARTEQLKERAGADVTGYDGVQRVVNLVDVMPLRSAADNLIDASLTARVKTALLHIDMPGFDPGRVKISTAHGNVYLMGLVSHKEADAVVAEARTVAGVKKVVQVFEYTD